MSAPVRDVILTLVSWIGCFWLGLQIGRGLSDQRRKADVDELERRFKIVDCKVVEASGSEGVGAHP